VIDKDLIIIINIYNNMNSKSDEQLKFKILLIGSSGKSMLK
jgi:hypothetical protein